MQPYTNLMRLMANAETDFDDGCVFTLHTSAYALARMANQYVSDLTSELATAGGYTVGGIPAGVVARTHTVANSWATTRAASQAYTVGDVVRPVAANTFLYRATTSGTTAVGLPAYPTILGQTVVDGGVTWECYGISITVVTSANPPSWASPFTATGIRYVVLSDRTTAVAATSPLLAVADLGADSAGTGSTWAITPHPTLGLFHFIHQ